MRAIGNDELLLVLALGFILVVIAIHLFLRRQARLLKMPLWTGSSSLPKLVTKARSLFDKGEFQDAANALENLLHEFEKIGNIPGIVSSANMIGICYERLQKYDEAVRAYSCATSVAYRKDFGDSLALAHKRLGYCHLRLGNTAAAQQSYARLAEIFQQQNDREACVRTLVSFANTLRGFGRLEEAGQAFEEARARAEKLKTTEGTCIVLHDRALLLRTLGSTPEALAQMREAAELSLTGKDLAVQARMFCSVAELLSDLGDNDQAEGIRLGAVELADRAQSPRERSLAQHVGARIAWSRGQRNKAHELLDLAEQNLHEDKEDKGGARANILISEADYAEETNDSETALRFLQDASETARQLNSRQRASLLNIKARALSKSGKREEALPVLHEAEDLARVLKAPLHQAAYDRTAGVVNYYLGDYAAAASHQQEALEFFKEAGFKRAAALTYKHLAFTWSAMGNRNEAARALEQARQIFLELGDTASATENS